MAPGTLALRAALAAAWSAGCASAAPDGLLGELLRGARGRFFGGDAAAAGVSGGPCSEAVAAEEANVFLSWPMHAAQFGQSAYAALEAVLFHHPAATVVVVSAALPVDMFDAYLREGYCVVSAPFDVPQAERLLSSALPQPLVAAFTQGLATIGEEALMLLLNCLVLALQVLHGGASLPMDGMLLNPLDFALPRQLRLRSTVVFLERLLPVEVPPQDGALQAEDFEKSWLPRAHTDRADGRTIVCADLACPRMLPRGSGVGGMLLQALVQGVAQRQADGAAELPNGDALATALYKMYVRRRPASPPIEVDGFAFDHDMALLPYWLVVESHFQDGWKAFGGQDDALTAHSQLYSPRPRRDAADWSLVSTAKLWLPLAYGPPSARNALPRSVLDMAMRHLALGLGPRPYRPKGFGRRGADASARRLRSPRDTVADFASEEGPPLRPEGGLPGDVGGFRTFRQLRLVGRDEERSGEGWRVVLRARGPALRLYCRREHRPVPAAEATTAAFRRCEAALVAGDAGAAADAWSARFDDCASPAELNAALTLLAYAPLPGLGTAPPPHEPGADLDFRTTGEELAAHFADIRVEAFRRCTAASPSHTAEFGALLDDPEDQVTVVAHSAERCHLLDRLAQTFREVYPRVAVVVTCECSEEEHCPEPAARAHAEIPQMTVVSVPYDFGLSRGKTLLARMASTEFTLVLDDDFTHSFHSCLECMLWRMRSHQHSLWRPFDILGFPVLEDERMFGAFRGQLRVTNRQLFLEPMIEQLSPDGCVRVDICPMVFLARTARLRSFKFQEELRVGEHEQFFYSNAYFGLQVAVCSDSSFPHFRVNTTSAGYAKRRERMPELMLSAFRSLGFERAMFLFRKYDHGLMQDYDELLGKGVPPWYISDDACGPRPGPPVPFSQVFAAVLSTGDAAGRAYRQVLRGQTGAAAAWLLRFAELDASSLRWVFAVTVDEADSAEVRREQEEHKDIVLVPSGQDAGVAATSEHLMRVFALLHDFQFRWLVVCQQDVFVHFERLLASLHAQDPPTGKALGLWRPSPALASEGGSRAAPAPWLDARFFALSRDVFALLASPRLSPLLKSVGQDSVLGDLVGGLNSWLRAFAVERVPLDGVHVEGAGAQARPCPPGTLALHPVTPEQLHALSLSPESAAC